MKYSTLTQRIQEKSDATDGHVIDPWAVHMMANERIALGEDITILSIGQEVHEQTPTLVVEKAVECLRAGRHHYADVRGELSLRTAIAAYHTRLTGQSANPDHITVFVGAQNALFSLAQILVEPGDEVILVAPYYTTYQATFGATGATVVTVTVDAQKHYQLDESKLLQAVTKNTQAIVLNAPNNPLGSRYTATQLKTIVETCIAQNIWLIMDTVYLDIVSTGSIDLPHSIPGAENILITVGSLSKSHRMTGWRVGWAVCPAELSGHLYNLSVCMHYGLPPFIMDAAVTAIEQSQATPALVRSVMQTRRKLAVAQLTNVHPAKLIDAGEGMFILLDVEALRCTAYEFAVELLDKEHVSVLPCDGFGPGGRYLIRIGLCIDGEALASACQRISRFIKHFSLN